MDEWVDGRTDRERKIAREREKKIIHILKMMGTRIHVLCVPAPLNVASIDAHQASPPLWDIAPSSYVVLSAGDYDHSWHVRHPHEERLYTSDNQCVTALPVHLPLSQIFKKGSANLHCTWN